MTYISSLLAFNGAIIILIGFLCGAPLGSAINHDKGDKKIAAWRLAHTGLIMGGMLLLILSVVIVNAQLSYFEQILASGAMIASTYGFAVALPYGAYVGYRGLQRREGGTKNLIVYIGNMIGATGSLLGILIFIIGFYRAF